MAQTSLLPVRHPTQDFFIADIFDALPVKNDRHTMEHPFFALSTKKDTRSVEYERDGIRIKLSPSAEFGLPTMMDKGNEHDSCDFPDGVYRTLIYKNSWDDLRLYTICLIFRLSAKSTIRTAYLDPPDP